MSTVSGKTHYGKPFKRNYAMFNTRSSLSRKPRSKSPTLNRYSRFSVSSSYAKLRRKQARKKNILVASLVVLFAILVAAAVSVLVFLSSMTTVFQKDFDKDMFGGYLVNLPKPKEPFWVLLQGTDNYDPNEAARSDTLILARIDPARKTVALVSIPRDTQVWLPGYGWQKINAAYYFGTLDPDSTGPGLSIRAVSELTGIAISHYIQIDINGFKDVVDALGGILVDVPVDVYNDYDWNAPAYQSEYPAISKGEQLLEGERALLFVRCRNYGIGDYQRQANQRTFLQALARQTLSANLITTVNVLMQLGQMTKTTFTAPEILSLASSLRGMKETDIYSYSIPCNSEYSNETWYEVPDMEKTKILMEALDAGIYPDPDELGLIRQGITPESYKPEQKPISDSMPVVSAPLNVNTGDFVVDTRNGCRIDGVATAVSDMLVIAGYQKGEIGNTNLAAYQQTLIIYRDSTDRDAALDIQARLGFGRVIPSLERYDFRGNILVVVGYDFGNKNT